MRAMSDGIHDDKDQVSDEQGRDPFTDEQEEKPSGDPFSVTEDAAQDAAEPSDPEDESLVSEGEGQKTEGGSSEPEDGSQAPGSSASGLESAHGAGEEEENPSASQAEDAGKTQEQAVQEPPEEHDFDDEPKFDTQTGEPLSKPKSKVPGILLTFAVTAGVVGAISAAVFNRDKWRSEGTEDHAQVETEARLQAAQETEAQADTEPSSEKAPLITSASGSGETEASETEQTNAAETEKGAQKSEKKGAESEESLAGKLGKNAVSLNTSLDVSDVAEEALPSVVSVTSQSVETIQSFFYGEQQIQTSNVGSGIVIDEDDTYYYIVTDAYLAAQAQNITVGFSVSGRKGERATEAETESAVSDTASSETAGAPESEDDGSRPVQNGAKSQAGDTLADAELVGADAGTELAVLAVKKQDVGAKAQGQISVASFGDSDSLKIGERVVAIGDSLGYGQSVTQGIVSALGRTMKTAYGSNDYIQTDASINYGNYGGALLNLDGEVVGINAGKINQDATERMGYALPANDAKTGIDHILSGRGSGRFGENGEKSEQAEAKTSETEQKKTENTENQAETEQTEISAQEQTIGKPSDILKRAEETQSESGSGESEKKSGMLGVRVADISEENQIVYRLPKGVYVASVEEGSGAEKSGLSADDVITKIGDQSVETVEDLRGALKGTKAGDTVKVTFVRADKDGKYDRTYSAKVILE
jgi:S1-C subfamily serine protease